MGQTVIFVTGKDPTGGHSGARSYVRACGRAAIRAGYEPHHFCAGPSTRTEITPFGVLHSARSPFRPFRGLMALAHGRYIVNAIEDFVAQRGGPCLIHSFNGWSSIGTAAARRLVRRGIRCVTVTTPFSTFGHETHGKLRGLTPELGLSTKLVLALELLWTGLLAGPRERRALRQSDLVVVNYDSVRAILERERVGALRCAKISYASEAAFLRSGQPISRPPGFLAGLEPSGAPLIVSVSRHDARKGIGILLRALAQLRAAGLQFRACLAGGGQLIERHRKYAAALGLLDCTAIPGEVADAYACLEHADIFVLPSLEEGSGSVSLLEAMQAGAAPVVSRVDGLPEDVSDEESALLAEPADVGDLARAIRRLIEDPDLRARIADNAHAVYRSRFSAEAFSADLARVYAGLGFPP